jgi:hypothetical protein
MSRYKVPNYLKAENLNNKNISNSGLYYGKVVAIDDELNEGQIKVSIPTFDLQSKVRCRDIRSNTLQTNNVTLKRVGGADSTNINEENGLTLISNLSQIEALTKRKNSGTIQKEVDNDACTEVPWAVPLLPKHLQVMPKIGEMCLVMVFDNNKPQQNRAWIGPLQSDKSKLSYEDADSGGDNLNSNVVPKKSKNTTVNITEDGKDLSKKGDFTGGFPEKYDVSIMGRNNADIVLPTEREGPDKLNTGGEVLIRAGKFTFTKRDDKNLSLNTVNPGFLRIKVTREGNGDNPQNFKTHSMLYSDYISLVSYKNSDGSAGVPSVFKINPILRRDQNLRDFHEALSPLIRGDKLVEFLTLLVNYIKNHNHPYHKLPSTNANSKPEIEKFDLNSLLSPHIRIN